MSLRIMSRRWMAACAVATLGVAGLVTPAPASADTLDMVEYPIEYVDPMIGTGEAGNSPAVAEVNNFPGVSAPFGMMQLSPDTPGAYAGYRYSHDRIRGFSLTHMAAGCWAYGDVPILPVVGDSGDEPWDYTASFSHDNESAEAGRYKVQLGGDNGITQVELAATTRAGALTFDFEGDHHGSVLIKAGDSLADVQNSQVEIVGNNTVTGSVTSGSFCDNNNQHTLYFTMEFDQDFTSFGTWNDGAKEELRTEVDGNRTGALLDFNSDEDNSRVKMKVGMSYVSRENAQANLDAEIPQWDFEKVVEDNKAEWNEVLSRVKVSADSDPDDLRMFYTQLYQAQLHPNTFNDVNGEYIGFDREIHTVQEGHTQYSNFAGWDTYRSLAALQTILNPEVASDQAQTLVNNAEQGGWLPKWPVANDYTGQMTGDPIPALISSIHAFGGTDFDVDTALTYMIKGANEAGSAADGYEQRPGIESYLNLKYGPQTEPFRGDHQIVGASTTLEYSITDFAIGQFAARLGDDNTAANFVQRSQYWQNVFNPATQRAAARTEDGAFVIPSDGGFGQVGFDEGTDLQYTWLVPHNVEALTQILGGPGAMGELLDDFTSEHNSGSNSDHLWIGNQPGLGVPWLYNYIGQAYRTSELIDTVIDSSFQPHPDGKPGNDDLGAMAAWYVWASSGMYPVTPGEDHVAINAPRFDRMVFDLGNREVEILAPGAQDGNRYVAGVSYNGQEWENTWLPGDLWHEGGVVEFSLTSAPTDWGITLEAAPPSFTEGGNDLIIGSTESDVSIEPGELGEVPVTIQQLGETGGTVTVDIIDSDGEVLGSEVLEVDEFGRATAEITVSVPQDTAQGYYELTLSADRGTAEIPMMLRSVSSDSLYGAYNTVGSASESNPSPGNFDGSGNSYSSEALAEQGLSPDSEGSVHDLEFRWPNVPDGLPNTVTTDGQTVSLDEPASALAVLGAATNGTQTGDLVMHLDDGTEKPVSLELGDWIFPTGEGSTEAIPDNTTIAQMDRRNGDKDQVFVFATEPFKAPEGALITGVTFPSNADLHVFTFATSEVEDPESEPVEITEIPDVTFTDESGTDKDVFTVHGVTGVEFLLDGEPIDPGTYPAEGTVTITAQPAEGYVFAPGITTEWGHTFSSESDSSESDPGSGGGDEAGDGSVHKPGAENSPGDSADPDSDPSNNTDESDLPFTGLGLTILGFSLVFLLAGVGLRLASGFRRRSTAGNDI